MVWQNFRRSGIKIIVWSREGNLKKFVNAAMPNHSIMYDLMILFVLIMLVVFAMKDATLFNRII